APHLPFADTDTEELGNNQLVIRVQPDEGMTLKFGSKVPGSVMEVRDVAMDFLYGEQFTETSPEAYERLLLDVLLGDATLFPRNAEVEASWAVIDPLEDFWAGTTPARYRAGEWGPRAADEMVVARRQIEAAVARRDAEVLIGGRLGPGEAVAMRMYGRLALHAESVVLPLLAADAPVVTWWHGAPPERMETDALAVIADRRITDSAIAEDQLAALRTRAEDYAPGDTDLSWTRSTPWRAILTSTLDSVAGRRGEPV